ncbi:phosphoribosylanthranilate isomerase [Niallia sp. NCCP-28]|uniref:phosphoribosylanthranilate isomerase n=1 Tax=Niallia sp. NCCP-28 TaxID=2934712 RepID=UPI00208C5EFA|nr:phosphoribosylanthranilate isomerase [Niallia sp. NCCP-28]GKU80748.1 N-(5'-phosphoribosyl)anthranilate isomerase [Niallia sp. NCCP-28]
MGAKICGITTKEAAQCALENGAKAVGFVFAKSKRKISAEDAKAIIKELPKDIWKVGVFVNESKEKIDEITNSSGINVIQLHGDESNEFAAQFSLPVIKAFSIQSEEDLKAAAAFECDYVLLDSPRETYHGGNGKTFDWTILKDYDFKGKKVILAGGLNTDNIKEALEMVQPDLVDVSSGVETDGKKDLKKIRDFLSIANLHKQ